MRICIKAELLLSQMAAWFCAPVTDKTYEYFAIL